MFPGGALKGRTTKPRWRPAVVNELGTWKEIAAGVSAPLQGLANALILETQAVGLGCDRVPLWGLKAPPPREIR
jgi:hypothetical protein